MDLTVLNQAMAAAGATGGANPNAWDISKAYYDAGADAWDVSKAFFPFTFDISSQEINAQGLFFKPDGTKMYVVGFSGDSVKEYSLSTPWLVLTASYVQAFAVGSQDTNPYDLFFKPDGTKMYVVGITNDKVYEYDLSTAWDISSASYSQDFSVLAQEDAPTGLFFKPDGTKMYVLGATGDDVNEYDLSTAWDISTASYVQNFSVATEETTPQSLSFKPDGTKMYVLGSTGDDVNEYSLSTPWDVSSASYVQAFSLGGETAPTGIFFNPNGSGFYVVGTSGDTVYQYAIGGFSVAAQEATPMGLFFKPDGTKMYICGQSGEVNEYDLSTAWDITTASYLQNFSTATQETAPNGLFFKPDGTKMYIVGQQNDKVYEYSLSSAWDISSASYVQDLLISVQETTPQDLFFKPDGTTMYVIGSSGDDVNQYSLSTAWDISSASYVQNFSVAGQDAVPTGLFFKPDGTKMYVMGETYDRVYEYALSSAWDISTSSYTTVFNRDFDTKPSAIFWKPDGTQFWTLGYTRDKIFSYLISPT